MADQVIGQSPEDQMFALLGGEGEEQQEEDQGESSEAEAEEEAGAEEGSEQSEEQQEEDEVGEDENGEEESFTIVHEGKELTKSKSELIELAQKGFDYTQKTQQVADDRRFIEQYAQSMRTQSDALQAQIKVQTAMQADFGVISGIDQQLAEYQKVDWQALSNQDPVQAQQLFFQLNQLQAKRAQLAGELDAKHKQYLQAEQTRMTEAAKAGIAVLQRDIPGWNNERATEIKQVGMNTYGFSDDELSSVIDPRMIKVLHDAAQWQKLQTSKPQVTNKVTAAKPVVKPGADNAKRVAQSNVQKLREKARASGRVEDAAQLIERML